MIQSRLSISWSVLRRRAHSSSLSIIRISLICKMYQCRTANNWIFMLICWLKQNNQLSKTLASLEIRALRSKLCRTRQYDGPAIVWYGDESLLNSFPLICPSSSSPFRSLCISWLLPKCPPSLFFLLSLHSRYSIAPLNHERMSGGKCWHLFRRAFQVDECGLLLLMFWMGWQGYRNPEKTQYDHRSHYAITIIGDSCFHIFFIIVICCIMSTSVIPGPSIRPAANSHSDRK